MFAAHLGGQIIGMMKLCFWVATGELLAAFLIIRIKRVYEKEGREKVDATNTGTEML